MPSWLGNTWSIIGTLWTALALAVAWLVPDTMEITGYREGDAQSNGAVRRHFAWRPSPVALPP